MSNLYVAVSGTTIHNLNNLYSLNDLHKASGGFAKHKPSNWLANKQTTDLIKEIEKAGIPAIQSKQRLGTFVCKELVIHYGMWISPEFSLQVIRTFLDVRYGDKTTTDQRTPLRDAVNLLVGKKGLMYPEAYSVIHQRFNVKHIDELSVDQVPMAIEYVHKLTLEAEWLPDQKKPLVEKKPEISLQNLKALISHMYWLRGWWSEFEPAIRGINPMVAASIHDSFNDGWFAAYGVANQLKIKTPDRNFIKNFPWMAGSYEKNQYYLDNKS